MKRHFSWKGQIIIKEKKHSEEETENGESTQIHILMDKLFINNVTQ